MSNKLKTATVLAFERKLDISDGFFWQLDSSDSTAKPIPVAIREKSVRGTISNRLSKADADPVKLDAKIQNPNLQTIDVATLDDDKNTLIVKWSCKVLPFAGEPNVCNDKDYRAKLLAVVGSYLQGHGVNELARRYAANIVNARWLWRNRLGAETISVNVKTNDSETNLTFDNAKFYGLNNFTSNDGQIKTLAELIEQGLTGEQFIILYIEARANVGYGQEVYPSQELVLVDTGNRKSKVLYQINDKAGMHSQKIGNAIRTIDDWYSDEVRFPIAIEPYGAVTTLGTAFRQPGQKQDFYNLLDNWILRDEEPSLEQQHYVIAVLIRGGVFGDSGKE